MLNKCFVLTLLVLTVSCTQESYVWYNGSFSDAFSEISNDQGKILFLDFLLIRLISEFLFSLEYP